MLIARLVALCLLAAAWASPAHSATDWLNFATVSMTSPNAGRLTTGYACSNDGKDLVCDSNTNPTFIGTGGLAISGGLTATTASLTTVSTTIIQVSGSTATCNTALKGSIRYSNTSNTLEYCNSTAWVSAGPSGTVVPAFSVNKNGTNQTVVPSTLTKLTWPNVRFDTNSNFASDRYTPTIAGKYLVKLSVNCTNNANVCSLQINKNGAAYENGTEASTGGTNQVVNAQAIVDMNGTTDYLEGYVYNGGGTTIGGAVPYTNFSGILISMAGGGSGGGTTPAGTTADIQFNNAGALAADTGNFTYASGLLRAPTVSATTLNSQYLSATTIFNPGTYSGNSVAANSVSSSLISGSTVSATDLQLGAGGICTAAVAGKLRYNTTSNTLQICPSTGIWTSLASGTTSGGGGSPAGSTGDIQFNTAGAFAADTGKFIYSGGSVTVSGSGAGYFVKDRTIGTTTSAFYRSGNKTHLWDSTGGDRITIDNATGNVSLSNHLFLSNTTSKTIAFGSSGVAAPGAGSAGMKLQLYGATPNVMATSDYALGIEPNTMWFNTSSIYKWYANAAERMSLDSTGNLTAPGTGSFLNLVTTNAYGLRQVVGNYGFMHYQDGANYYMLITNSGDQYGSFNGLRPFYVNLASGAVTMANNAYASAFLYTSDKRLKSDITPLTGGLAKLESINPVSFRFTKDVSKTIHLGVIAQDIEKVYPQAVTTDDKGMKAVDYPALVGPMLGMIKELKAANENLVSVTTSLKAANDNVKNELDALKRDLQTLRR